MKNPRKKDGFALAKSANLKKSRQSGTSFDKYFLNLFPHKFLLELYISVVSTPVRK
jgi:hypothetical protein